MWKIKFSQSCEKRSGPHDSVSFGISFSSNNLKSSSHINLLFCCRAQDHDPVASPSLDQALAAGQKLLFDFRILWYTDEFSPNHQPSTTVQHSQHEVLFLVLCPSVVLRVVDKRLCFALFFCSLYKGHCSRSPAVCLYVTLQAVLPCYF